MSAQNNAGVVRKSGTSLIGWPQRLAHIGEAASAAVWQPRSTPVSYEKLAVNY